MRYLPSALAKLRTHYRPGCHLINQAWGDRTNLILVCGRENHQIIGVRDTNLVPMTQALLDELNRLRVEERAA